MIRLFNAVGAFVALGAAIVLAAAPASAQVVDASSPEDVAAVMEANGLGAEIEYLDDAEGPVISSSTDSLQFLITFEACDEDGYECELIVFRCGFSMEPEDQPDLDMINGWNGEFWGKASLDEEGNPWIALEINVIGGLTEGNLVDTLTWWDGMMNEFASYIGYQP